jgi:N-glycosylase/DNA lyase
MASPASERARLLHDAGLLRELLGHEGWACYQRYLSAEMERVLVRVLDCALEHVEAQRGLYRGLQAALTLPQRVLAQAETVTGDAAR